MRILFLAAEPPWPLDQGDKLRNYYLLKALAERHEVTLACFCAPGDGCGRGGCGHWRKELGSLCREIYAVPLNRRTMIFNVLKRPLQPFTMAARASRRMSELVGRLSCEQGYEIIFACQLKMAGYLQSCARGKKVAELTDVLSVYRRRMHRFCRSLPDKFVSRLETARLAYWEKKTAGNVDLTILVSPSDAAALKRMAPEARIAVLPNGVNLEYFKPAGHAGGKVENHIQFREAEKAVCHYPPVPELQDEPEKAVCSQPSVAVSQLGPQLLFYGHLRYPPNYDGITWFMREIFPQVRSFMPGAKLMIIGKDAPAALVRVARMPGVSMAGYVPDIRPYLARATVVVAPLRFGAGVRNKILEALAVGRAVVSTTLGCEGLAVVPGKHLEVADEPTDFARILVELLQNPVKRALLEENGLELISKAYDWELIGKELNLLIDAFSC